MGQIIVVVLGDQMPESLEEFGKGMRVRKNARLDTGTTELGRDVTLDLSEFLLKSIEAGLNRILPLSIVCKQRVQKSLVGNPGFFWRAAAEI